ncbi:hypothetical protein F5887DRAFT_962858 [Amanita rubescens]|nr:hypothetical protein F5887DRAFT_962858 [Amanita rubescens]
MTSSTEEKKSFQTVYTALWKQPLDSILRDAPANAGEKVLKYIPFSLLAELGLTSINYREKVLLVREEYNTVLDTLEDWNRLGGGGVIVTGQAGIGKTIFLFYVLLRRLSAGLPTAFHVFSDRFFLFTEAGASQHDVVDQSGLKLPPGTWALSNSGEVIEQPCAAFLSAPPGRAWIIQATSPKRSRWREWKKQLRAKLYVMDWFHPNELRVLGQLLGLNTTALLSYYRTWGPCARTCIAMVKGRLTVDEHNRNVSIAAGNSFGLITQFDSDEVWDVLFFVRPDKLSADSRSAIRAEIPTKHLRGIVALSVAQIDAAQQSLFFSQISSHPWTKGLADWMYEKFVHIRLTSPTAPPLMCIPTDEASPTLMIPVCDIIHPLNGKTGLSEANKYSLPFYWRPTSTSFTSINGIICTNSDIILVQATVSSQHDVKVSGLDAIRNGLPVGFCQERNFCLVFITVPTEESDQELCYQNMSLPECWKNLVIYSTFVIGKLNDVDQAALTTYIEEDDEAEDDNDKE